MTFFTPNRLVFLAAGGGEQPVQITQEVQNEIADKIGTVRDTLDGTEEDIVQHVQAFENFLNGPDAENLPAGKKQELAKQAKELAVQVDRLTDPMWMGESAQVRIFAQQLDSLKAEITTIAPAQAPANIASMDDAGLPHAPKGESAEVANNGQYPTPAERRLARHGGRAGQSGDAGRQTETTGNGNVDQSTQTAAATADTHDMDAYANRPTQTAAATADTHDMDAYATRPAQSAAATADAQDDLSFQEGEKRQIAIGDLQDAVRFAARDGIHELEAAYAVAMNEATEKYTPEGGPDAVRAAYEAAKQAISNKDTTAALLAANERLGGKVDVAHTESPPTPVVAEVAAQADAVEAIPASLATSEVAGQEYVIQSGDTLGAIAKKFLGDASRYPEIAAANGISNPDKIFAGQKLTIPGVEAAPATRVAEVSHPQQSQVSVDQLPDAQPAVLTTEAAETAVPATEAISAFNELAESAYKRTLSSLIEQGEYNLNGVNAGFLGNFEESSRQELVDAIVQSCKESGVVPPQNAADVQAMLGDKSVNFGHRADQSSAPDQYASETVTNQKFIADRVKPWVVSQKKIMPRSNVIVKSPAPMQSDSDTIAV